MSAVEEERRCPVETVVRATCGCDNDLVGGGARAEVRETEEESEGGRRSNLKYLSVKTRKDAL